MKTMPLFRRLIGTICDKVLILVFFIMGFLAIEGIWGAMDRGVTYLSLVCHAPSEYSNITLNNLFIIDKGYQLKYSQETKEEIILKYENADVEGIVRNFDLTITFSFILLNILYYLLCEIFLSASFGKALLGGKLVDSFCNRISSSDVFKRAIIGALLMSLAVGLRFFLDLDYIITVVLFFLILDISIFIKRRSLIDILSKVTYSDDLSIIKSIRTDKIDKSDVTIIGKKDDQNDAPTPLANTPKQIRLDFLKIPQIRFVGLRDYTKLKKASLYIYIIWGAINIIAFAYAMANPHRVYKEFLLNDDGEVNTRDFYPFESCDIGNYDFSEFIVYTLAIPLCLFAIIKLIFLFTPHKYLNS